jgi:hypothetical protein
VKKRTPDLRVRSFMGSEDGRFAGKELGSELI